MRYKKRKKRKINFISTIIIFLFILLLLVPSSIVCISNLRKSSKKAGSMNTSLKHNSKVIKKVANSKIEDKKSDIRNTKVVEKDSNNISNGKSKNQNILNFNKSLNSSLKFSKEIKVLIKNENKVITIPIEDYIKGVVSAEMPASFPIEALKAQAVAARTYTYMCLNNGAYSKKADITDDYKEYQAFLSKEARFKEWPKSMANKYWDKISKAVDETKGQLMFYKNNIIYAAFHSNSGGITEDGSAVTGEDYPYLKSVVSPDEQKDSDYKSQECFSINSFNNILKKLDDQYVALNKDNLMKNIKVVSKTPGERVDKLKVNNSIFSGTEIRSAFSLKSTNFSISQKNTNVVFTTLGFGHGMGMSQFGANEMALNGYNYCDILNHYYYKIDIMKVY